MWTMTNLPATLSSSHLWQTTLAAQTNDRFHDQRQRLRSSFLSFRERAAHLAGEIRKDLTDLTVHDLTHLDALWEVASTISGSSYALTPTEAFVFGGAILLHDLAMSVTAVPGGLVAVKKDLRWRDLVTSEYRATRDRDPSAAEISKPDVQIEKRVLFELLRQLHAENAEKLAFVSYPSSSHEPLFLIEDAEIRQTFGRVIGRVAHSHWWSIGDVENQFSRVVGPPHWCPPDWTIDPLRVACLLRAADAAHLDATRAPMFLRAISKLSPSAEKHWSFQEKLNKPYLREDALVFTSGGAFALADAGAWWLCLETLRMVDRELRSVDALFSDKGFPRFQARSVAGVDLPERLISYIQTEGWFPINATVHVTDLPRIIRSIGGDELYGKRPEIAVRELVQNSSDAIRARRLYEHRDPDFGRIAVVLSETASGEYWLEVTDDGVGMSQRVLTDFLLDFGRAFWGSPQMQEEFPGLLSSGIRPTGKYGIGFFSVFMVSEQVQVVTRRADSAAKDTLVLEFSSGLDGRPILRPAKKNEQLIDSGTVVRLKLLNHPRRKGGLLHTYEGRGAKTVVSLCRSLCPALDVDLYVTEDGKTEKAVGAQDWLTLNGSELLSRMEPLDNRSLTRAASQKFRERAAANLRLLKGAGGESYGRACITVGFASHLEQRVDLHGTVTVGGLKACSLTGIMGILVGQPTRAARDGAIPIVPPEVLKKWAEEQAELVPKLWEEPQLQAGCAQYIRICGGSTKRLPITIFRGQWLSVEDLAKITDPPGVAILIDHFTMDYELKLLKSLKFHNNVFITNTSAWPGLLQSPNHDRWPGDFYTSFVFGKSGDTFLAPLAGVVIDGLAAAWKVNREEVVAANDLKKEQDVAVATDDGREIKVRGITIARPSVAGRGNGKPKRSKRKRPR